MHIHILSIAGQGMTTALALGLKNQGHFVTGSDQTHIYPPASTQLAAAQIPVNTTPIDASIDLAIIGSGFKAFSQTQQEFAHINQLKIPYLSATNYIAQNIIKKNSILIAGAYGKTTITALVVWILTQAGYQPSYFFGGQSKNNLPSLQFSDSDWSVVEADESINGLDTQAKFLYYPTTHLVLTSAAWEHKDSYPTADLNKLAFQKLVNQIPPNGFLVYNPTESTTTPLLPICLGQKLPYNQKLDFPSQLIGDFNHANILAAATLCLALGVDQDTLAQAIKSFAGIHHRLDQTIINNRIFIDDFAQSAPRLTQAIAAIQKHYPSKTLKIFFEPHASFLQHRQSLIDFDKVFKSATEVVLSPIKFNPTIDKNDRSTAVDYRRQIGDKLLYLPDYDQIYNHFIATLTSNDILVHFSSGGLDGLTTYQKIINYFS